MLVLNGELFTWRNDWLSNLIGNHRIMLCIVGNKHCLFEKSGRSNQAIRQGNRLAFFSPFPLKFSRFFSHRGRNREVNKSFQKSLGRIFFGRAHPGMDFSHRNRRTSIARGGLQFPDIGLETPFLSQVVDQDIAIQEIGQHANARPFDSGADFEGSASPRLLVRHEAHETMRHTSLSTLFQASAAANPLLQAPSGTESVRRQEQAGRIADRGVRETRHLPDARPYKVLLGYILGKSYRLNGDVSRRATTGGAAFGYNWYFNTARDGDTAGTSVTCSVNCAIFSNAAAGDFHEFVSGAPPPPPSGSPCDVNKDNTTNIVDVQQCVNQSLGVATCTADINNDGICNVVDVQRVVNAALGGQCVNP